MTEEQKKILRLITNDQERNRKLGWELLKNPDLWEGLTVYCLFLDSKFSFDRFQATCYHGGVIEIPERIGQYNTAIYRGVIRAKITDFASHYSDDQFRWGFRNNLSEGDMLLARKQRIDKAMISLMNATGIWVGPHDLDIELYEWATVNPHIGLTHRIGKLDRMLGIGPKGLKFGFMDM